MLKCLSKELVTGHLKHQKAAPSHLGSKQLQTYKASFEQLWYVLRWSRVCLGMFLAFEDGPNSLKGLQKVASTTGMQKASERGQG